jgi:hypothetical protein
MTTPARPAKGRRPWRRPAVGTALSALALPPLALLGAATRPVLAGADLQWHLFPPVGRTTSLPFRGTPDDFARYMGEVASRRWGFEVRFSELSGCAEAQMFATRVYRCDGGRITRTAPSPASPGCVPRRLGLIHFEQNTDTGRRTHLVRTTPCLGSLADGPAPVSRPVSGPVSEPVRGLW